MKILVSIIDILPKPLFNTTALRFFADFGPGQSPQVPFQSNKMYDPAAMAEGGPVPAHVRRVQYHG